ncbi:6-phosphogluconolactonase [Denitrificimonas sp. JX-1]|uniref:6-phosphogluconolactonase n=1 Tax=Denitrificimonas halotolerans TaxID=3098930 RepID=A0ABU5GQH2_9GAMM|nr:6-phosphogluconolactonase [Denitrificimonas sp. JX-1]MDY7218832.1 6-phosphogluconolactonase [Denitrificimonas sp. JX-1]
MSQAQVHKFINQQACNEALTQELASCIMQAFTTQAKVSVILPGGSTPGGLLQLLSQEDMRWSDLQVSPTDERWVAADSEYSNSKMLAQALPQAQLLDPRLADSAEASSVAWAAVMQKHLPVAATLLGMGGDGHIASLFPGMPGLATALQLCEEPSALVGLAPDEPEVRLSLNLSMLCATQWLGLLVFGEEKWQMLERVLAHDPTTQALPIYQLLWHAPQPIHIYWAP